MKQKPKLGKIVEGAEQLSLGISIVVAVLIGVGLGIWMKNIFGYGWLLWLGVFWGVAAAVLNIYKAYKKQMKELEKLKDDVRYKDINQEYFENNDE
jgi:F0F1-type ATP synthase assembly protein I